MIKSIGIMVTACAVIAGLLAIGTEAIDAVNAAFLWALMVTIIGAGLAWKHGKEFRGPVIGALIGAFILFTMFFPGRAELMKKLALSGRSYVGDVVQATSAVTSEPLPKKVVTVKFGPNERVLTGAMQKRNQWAEIKPTVPVKIKYPAEPSGYRVISSSLKSQNVTCDLGEIVLYSGDKPGEATISLY